MKVRAIALCFAAVAALAFSEPSAASLNALLDPTIGLKEIYRAATKDGGAGLPKDKFFLLSGRLGIVIDRSVEDGPYSGESEITGGEWEGMDAVHAFRAYLRFSGDRFSALSDKESEDYVKPGTLVVVIGSLAGSTKEYGSDRTAAVIKVERLIKVE